MKNKEKYKDELIKAFFNDECCEFMETHNLASVKESICRQDCETCKDRFTEWLEQEHQEEMTLDEAEEILQRALQNEMSWTLFFSGISNKKRRRALEIAIKCINGARE